MLKKHYIRYVLSFILIFVLIAFSFSNICYAVAVTDENLKSTLQKFVSSEANEDNYKITVADNVIKITADGKDYTLNYDLTDKPTFTFEIPIEQGMSYENYEEQIDNLILPMIGYIAVANIQGVEFEDANAYFLMSYLGNAFNGSTSSESSYIIIDDSTMADGVTINIGDKKIIYVSEFGDNVMDYVNDTYKDKQIIKDSPNGINSYEWIIERKDVNDTSCKLVSSLSVNLDADFSKLNGYSDQLGGTSLDKNITEENADYAITLKIGQKCIIETTEEVTGYGLTGSGYEYNLINDNCIEITGEEVGKANGYIYVGETKKTIFITVEENTESTSLDTIILKIDTTSETDNSNESDNKQEETPNANDYNKNNTPTDSTISKTTLPKAGVNNIVCIVMLFSLVLIIIFSIKLKKYKYIK